MAGRTGLYRHGGASALRPVRDSESARHILEPAASMSLARGNWPIGTPAARLPSVVGEAR
jgi:hypothetical protein